MKDNPIDIRYQELAEKWMNGTISSAEQSEFASWYALDQDKTVIVSSDFAQDEMTQRNRMLAKVKWNNHRNRISKRLYRWSIAATIAILAGIGSVYFLQPQQEPTRYANDIQAGKPQATLILANGQHIDLNHAPDGKLAEQAGARIFKNQEGKIVYQANHSENEEIAMNTIATPLAGQYQVVLPDQSIVWLNAGSSITFPTSFEKSAKREVSIKGEAYFEVMHNDKKPFLVSTQEQQIKVLGTHFNVKSYANDPAVTTTLIQGSISLNDQLILKPNEQATNRNGAISVSTVDPEYAVAWKAGKFKFQNTNITEIMKDVARWYDVEVVYQDRMDNKEFSGVVSRFDNISKLLTVLESTNTIHFKIEGRRITVMK